MPACACPHADRGEGVFWTFYETINFGIQIISIEQQQFKDVAIVITLTYIEGNHNIIKLS